MAGDENLLTLTSLGPALDHPEAVAWGPDGRVHAGGEAGQLYRFALDGSGLEEVARVAGGFILGLAHDADGNTYACDDRNACVHRITPEGRISTYANGNERRRMRVPNYPAFDDAGNLYVSDSGDFGARNGLIWKVPPGGRAEIWDESANGFTNGLCLAADGRTLYVAESSPPLISAIEIRTDGTAGARRVVVELPRQVPDGVALDRAGNLTIAMYTPNRLYRFGADGKLVMLYDDWEMLKLIAPTNVAFGGHDLSTLLVASLCGWAVHAAPMPVPGLKLRYPKL
jgi:gluconolactonase